MRLAYVATIIYRWASNIVGATVICQILLLDLFGDIHVTQEMAATRVVF